MIIFRLPPDTRKQHDDQAPQADRCREKNQSACVLSGRCLQELQKQLLREPTHPGKRHLPARRGGDEQKGTTSGLHTLRQRPQNKSTMTHMSATSTYEQAYMRAHAQCSVAASHLPQALSTSTPLPTAPQPPMTNENAQHMCHDGCFSVFSSHPKPPPQAHSVLANCAMLPAQQH